VFTSLALALGIEQTGAIGLNSQMPAELDKQVEELAKNGNGLLGEDERLTEISVKIAAVVY